MPTSIPDPWHFDADLDRYQNVTDPDPSLLKRAFQDAIKK
jgi:hypothetical protein